MNHEQNYQNLRQKVRSLQNSLNQRANNALNEFDEWSQDGVGGGAVLNLGKSEAYREVERDVEDLLAKQNEDEQASRGLVARASLLRNRLQERAESSRKSAAARPEDDPRSEESYLETVKSYECALKALYDVFPEVKLETHRGGK